MFPGAVVYVSRAGRVVAHEAFGSTTYDPAASRPIRLDDLFDLASLTKLYTTALVLHLVERGVLRLDDPVRRHVPEAASFAESQDCLKAGLQTRRERVGSPGSQDCLKAGLQTRRERVRSPGSQDCLKAGLQTRRERVGSPGFSQSWTIEDLLAHRTGVTADLLGEAIRHGIRPCEPGQSDALWRIIFACRPAVELREGQSHYSDVDFLLAQAVCERATGRGLASLMASEVPEPLGLRETCFIVRSAGFSPYRPLPSIERCVPTEFDDRWRHCLVAGEVHDEVAATLGGVAGHAGLFATAGDVGRFCQMWLREAKDGGRWGLAFAPHSDQFGLGWRLCNASFSPRLERFGAVGHLGFTGTSAFLFPRSGTVFVLLSNRVHPRRDAAPSRLLLLAQIAELVAD